MTDAKVKSKQSLPMFHNTAGDGRGAGAGVGITYSRSWIATKTKKEKIMMISIIRTMRMRCCAADWGIRRLGKDSSLNENHKKSILGLFADNYAVIDSAI